MLAELPVQQWPSEANFILFRPLSPEAATQSDAALAGNFGDLVWQGLVDRSVLVRNCSSWPRLSGCLRVTLGTAAENTKFLDALAEVLT